MPHGEYLASLPRKRLASGVLIRDDQGRVLLVWPTYKERWILPGGTVEADESPAQAAAREVAEELGPRQDVGRLLGIAWIAPTPQDPHGAIVFDYDGGVWTPQQVTGIRLPTDELRGHRFVEPHCVADLTSERTAARIHAALEAHARGGVGELPARHVGH